MILTDIEIINTNLYIVTKLCWCSTLSSFHFRYKLRAYKESCEYHKLKGCVEPLSKCRAAKLGIMGTVLMTNCTCDGVPHSAGQYKECLSTRRLLTQNNICEGTETLMTIFTFRTISLSFTFFSISYNYGHFGGEFAENKYANALEMTN